MAFLDKIFGSYSERELKKIRPIANGVMELEEKYSSMSENELKNQTNVLKQRLSNGETLNDILKDAFAVVREASFRVLNMKHFEVQVIGGIALHQGRIAEMRTGEGKTLVCTLPAYLNALTGKGVHVVTVNDYLAKRDSEWMGKIYTYLGLTVGLAINGLSSDEKRKAYDCDITYGTNNEYGFDYLRDNMVLYKEQKVQRGHNFVIIDEVDSVLIDEARTPLIISGAGDKSTELYDIVDKFAKKLTFTKVKELNNKEDNDELYEVDYIVDEKAKTATLTKAGIKKAENHFNIDNLMENEHISIQHHINQAIKAQAIMQKDIDYIVRDNQVVIVDEFTGRIMEGRRYSDGLHQAIEAKEGVKVERESKTLATITFQNYFRLYNKISGMTGTAMTEENEFREIYKLDVLVIPTNKEVRRIDHNDIIYKTENAKYNAVVEKAFECYEKGQPLLIGTISIDKSELLSKLLSKKGIKHNVLNAKNHHREAEIVAQAGKFKAVTIATNMAGRGTDIVLGRTPLIWRKMSLVKDISDEVLALCDAHNVTLDEDVLKVREEYEKLVQKYKVTSDEDAIKVKEVGGLFIIGTERHESRRIDNQLRGRSGRQGDIGETVFYLSLEDDLMRLFGGEKIYNLMDKLNIDDETIIENKMITSQIESAQRKIEGRNFSIRKNVLGFDDVMNAQRHTIYSQRTKVLNGDDLKQNTRNMISDSITDICNLYLNAEIPFEEWNIVGLRNYYLGMITEDTDFIYDKNAIASDVDEDIRKTLIDRAFQKCDQKEEICGSDTMREVERVLLLGVVDRKWTEHIDNMEELKRGIYLRSYAQKDPVTEYRIEGFNMFDDMIETIKDELTRAILLVQINKEEDIKRENVVTETTEGFEDLEKGNIKKATKTPIHSTKIGRNELCPCGSGKKYKKCCGK